jgi:hypothetical protein
MKPRVMIAGAAVALGVLAPLAVAVPPAAAGSGVGCTGTDCSVKVWQFVTHGGGHWSDNGTTSSPINVPPPPCLWNPIGDATTGSQYIITNDGFADPTSPFDIYQSLQQAKQLLKNPQPGEWYILPINPAAGAAGAAACLRLPLFAFVPPGGAPPMPPIPPQDLAEYAYNHMVIRKPGVVVSGHGKGWVNLGTYVWVREPGQVTIWAQLGADQGTRVTLTATPGTPTITSNPAGDIANNCGIHGSRSPVGQPPAAGPGKMPDCGVLWRTPAAAATVTVSVTWTVRWTGGGQAGTLPPITVNRTVGPLNVQEIQSINGN